MTPHETIMATLNNGPGTETLLVSKLIAKGYQYDNAVIAVKNALCDLLAKKDIEMVHGANCYRVTKV